MKHRRTVRGKKENLIRWIDWGKIPNGSDSNSRRARRLGERRSAEISEAGVEVGLKQQL